MVAISIGAFFFLFLLIEPYYSQKGLARPYFSRILKGHQRRKGKSEVIPFDGTKFQVPCHPKNRHQFGGHCYWEGAQGISVFFLVVPYSNDMCDKPGLVWGFGVGWVDQASSCFVQSYSPGDGQGSPSCFLCGTSH